MSRRAFTTRGKKQARRKADKRRNRPPKYKKTGPSMYASRRFAAELVQVMAMRTPETTTQAKAQPQPESRATP